MKSNAERVLSDLQALVHELEHSFKSCAAEGLEDAGERVKDTLARAREKIEDLESTLRREVRQGAKAADRYVHSNPWASIGIAAAVAFIVGALVSRREPD